MKVDIKLKDPKYCDQCPCMNFDCEQGQSCNLYDYYDMAPPPYDLKFEGKKVIRLKKCIKEHGL